VTKKGLHFVEAMQIMSVAVRCFQGRLLQYRYDSKTNGGKKSGERGQNTGSDSIVVLTTLITSHHGAYFNE
jgi:hypothetical protein